MRQSKVRNSESHALIKKPSFAVLVTGDGHAGAAGIGLDSEREVRIREAAYARYERRGQAHGHDLDDWLAAEAAVDGKH